MKNLMVEKQTDSLVKFSSSVGCGVAVWRGEELYEDYCYDAELHIEDVFEWGLNINKTNNKVAKIICLAEHVIFYAKVISCEKDGVVTVSLGGDVIFIEVAGFYPEAEYITFFTSASNISLYQVNL